MAIETHTINRHRVSFITLITLITLTITPVAVAEIFKCNGPDGPIYSDRDCGQDAENVELLDTSGLSGVSEQDKSDLAEKKLEREQARSQNQQSNIVNNQSNAYTTENSGRWRRGQNRLRDRDNPNTLPAKPRPAVSRKKRR